MSYDDIENSVDDASPTFLYSFTNETFQFYYTNSHAAITYSGNTYLPLQITHTPLKQTAVLIGSDEYDITMPLDCELADNYAKPYAPPDFRIRVFKHHRSGETKKRFIGDTIRFTPMGDGSFVVTMIPHLQMLLNRRMLANKWANKCNHDLYDNRCGLDRADFTWTTTVTAVSGGGRGQYITVANDHNSDGDLVIGDMIINGEYRIILENIADVIKVRYPYTLIEVGDAVTLVAGCRKNRRACIDFDNFRHYGGFNLTPIINKVATPFPGVVSELQST